MHFRLKQNDYQQTSIYFEYLNILRTVESFNKNYLNCNTHISLNAPTESDVVKFYLFFPFPAPVMTLIGYTCHEEKWDTSGFGNLHQALKSEDEAVFCITFN